MAHQPADWWRRVVGSMPEGISQKPQVGELQAIGPFGSGRLVLNVDPLRVDWLLVPNEPQGEGPDFVNVGELDSSVEQLLTSLSTWMTDAPAISRIALGSSLLLPVSDRAAGYRRLQALLPAVQIDVENSSDFSYGINRPRESVTIPGLRINRVSKWSVQIRSFAAVVVTGAAAAAGTSLSTTLACRAELDINSSADNTQPIDQASVLPLFREFARLASELAVRGDVR
jgi:hypothetical protein